VFYDAAEHHHLIRLETRAENPARPPMTVASWALLIAGLSLLVATIGTMCLQFGRFTSWRTVAVSVSAFLFALVVLGFAIAYGQ
jgi:hypothetical protein